MHTEQKSLTALVSIHDVMPETLGHCTSLIEPLLKRDLGPITLLVVPGREWSTRDLDTLRAWQAAGCQLAGHGWTHEATHIHTLYHKLHSLILSRRAAEHLSQQEGNLLALIRRCHGWFVEHDLGAPALYVPPAWALGNIRSPLLADLPFTMIEVLRGVIRLQDQSLLRLPLTGYEADNSWRAWNLKPWNSWNEKRAIVSGKPLRIGIHPYDNELRLSRQLWQQLDHCQAFVGYEKCAAA
ncbi:MAG: polysaccharide deacetylase family protein [Gammaproteobacteria bacterium]